ncbi:Emopamil-binding protein [Naviculisporaceae sp. PSN 640]
MWKWLLNQVQSTSGAATHPYHPSSAKIANYSPNTTPIWITGSVFAVLITAFIGVGSFALGKISPGLSSGTGRTAARRITIKGFGFRLGFGLGSATRFSGRDQFGIGWFLLCGFLHCFFESYYVLNYDTLASKQTLFAQLWKEYSLSDSRYLSQDLFVLTIESLTVLTLGPLSLLTAILIARQSSLRYLSQAVVSSMHLFSVALYYGMCFVSESVNGYGYSRPQFLYYWVYFVGFNAPWVLVPIYLLYQSGREIKGAFDLVKEVQVRSSTRVSRAAKKEM